MSTTAGQTALATTTTSAPDAIATDSAHGPPVKNTLERNIVLDFAISFLVVFVLFMAVNLTSRFFWRRRNRQRLAVDVEYLRQRTLSAPVSRRRPVLYDTWSSELRVTSGKSPQWDTLIPLSTQPLRDHIKQSSPPVKATTQLDPLLNPSPIERVARALQLRSHLAQQRQQQDEPTDGLADASILRIGVLISMPTQRRTIGPMFPTVDLGTCVTSTTS